MQKSTLGFLLGFFIGVLGLLGLLACSDKPEKDEFMSGWIKGFIVSLIVGAIIGVIVFFICLSPLFLLTAI